MSFQDIRIKTEYRSLIDDIVDDFYIPILKNTISYKRAVGFFSSSSLYEIIQGIGYLVKNDGLIKVIASPRLSQSDIVAINEGKLNREKIIEKYVFSEIDDFCKKFNEDGINLLSYLVANEILDIRIAVCDNDFETGIYHEKMGLFYDKDGNVIAFSGSMNESNNAYSNNYEAIDVYSSWGLDRDRVILKENAFQRLWNNTEKNITVYDFPEAAKKRLLESTTGKSINFDILPTRKCYANDNRVQNIPQIPNGFELRDYQKKAIANWMNNKSCGIFDMATGTGKTYTGLGAITKLSYELKHRLAVVIVCPFQHLVEQWVEDLNKFNIYPIIGYSSSSQKNWKVLLETAIRDQKLNVKNRSFLCFITTNKTFSSEYVQNMIHKIRGDICLVVDEAHNIGARSYAVLLEKNLYKYRLGLSATLDRYNDSEGTKILHDFFGEKCIEYTLEEAINQGKLTPYKYYPVFVYLDEDELATYRELSFEMGQNLIKGKNGKLKLNKHGEMLAIQRARLVAGAKSKLGELRRRVYDYKNGRHILVYCGATMINVDESDFMEIDSSEIRQIDAVINELGNELGMKVAKFTSEESSSERMMIKQSFAEGKSLQALVAIKCLDEGVDIPDIRTAFILASTTNPKEYIQRRGRVLRLAEGKQYSEIYDFVTLPRELDDVLSLTEQQIKREISLVKNELRRMIEFSRLSLNEIDSYDLIREISEAYNIQPEDLEETDYDS